MLSLDSDTPCSTRLLLLLPVLSCLGAFAYMVPSLVTALMLLLPFALLPTKLPPNDPSSTG